VLSIRFGCVAVLPDLLLVVYQDPRAASTVGERPCFTFEVKHMMQVTRNALNVPCTLQQGMAVVPMP